MHKGTLKKNNNYESMRALNKNRAEYNTLPLRHYVMHQVRQLFYIVFYRTSMQIDNNRDSISKTSRITKYSGTKYYYNFVLIVIHEPKQPMMVNYVFF